MRIQRVAEDVRRTAGLARLVPDLTIDGVGDTPRRQRPREHVGNSSEDRFGGEIGPPRIDDREHQRGGAFASKLARHLQRRGAAR